MLWVEAQHSGVFFWPWRAMSADASVGPGKSTTLAAHLAELLASGMHSDVTLVVDGTEISAHRGMLAARSPVFAAMFAHNMAEKLGGRVLIDDIPLDVFRAFLSYLYTDTIPNPDGPAFMPMDICGWQDTWRHCLAVGDKVDAMDGVKRWYLAEVKKVNATQVFVHFEGAAGPGGAKQPMPLGVSRLGAHLGRVDQSRLGSAGTLWPAFGCGGEACWTGTATSHHLHPGFRKARTRGGRQGPRGGTWRQGWHAVRVAADCGRPLPDQGAF